MMHIKKSTLLIIAVLVVVLGLTTGQNLIGNYYSQSSSSNSQSAESVVYIENGVSGLVTITDPFMNRTTDINVIYAPLSSGSGFIVNGDGYIVTAFHILSDPDTLRNQRILKLMDSSDVQRYLEQAAVSGYLSKYNPQLGSQLVNYNVSGNPPHLQAQPDTNTTTEVLNQRNLLTVKSSQQLVRVKLPGTNTGNYLDAKIVDIGSSGTDEDVALLKVEPLFKNLPSLGIRSSMPVIGEKIQIYGYPVIDRGMYSDINQTITPSSTTGFLTSEVSNNGVIYYETDAQTIQGYSGGPVMDFQNNVLGIIIYSVESDQQFREQRVTSSLFLSSEYIVQICDKNNVSIKVV